jgi:hypothetical protein
MVLQPADVHISPRLGGIYEWDDPKINDRKSCRLSARDPRRLAYGGSTGTRFVTLLREDLDWTSQGTPWDTWNYLEAFDYNTKQGLGGSTWPLWMSDDFTNPGTCGDPSNPACGPIYRWGNPKNECYSDPIGRCLLTTGPTGPVSQKCLGPRYFVD